MLEVALCLFLISITMLLALIYIKLNDISRHLLAIRHKADLMYSIVDVLNLCRRCFKGAQVIYFENGEESEDD